MASGYPSDTDQPASPESPVVDPNRLSVWSQIPTPVVADATFVPLKLSSDVEHIREVEIRKVRDSITEMNSLLDEMQSMRSANSQSLGPRARSNESVRSSDHSGGAVNGTHRSSRRESRVSFEDPRWPQAPPHHNQPPRYGPPAAPVHRPGSVSATSNTVSVLQTSNLPVRRNRPIRRSIPDERALLDNENTNLPLPIRPSAMDSGKSSESDDAYQTAGEGSPVNASFVQPARAADSASPAREMPATVPLDPATLNSPTAALTLSPGSANRSLSRPDLADSRHNTTSDVALTDSLPSAAMSSWQYQSLDTQPQELSQDSSIQRTNGSEQSEEADASRSVFLPDKDELLSLTGKTTKSFIYSDQSSHHQSSRPSSQIPRSSPPAENSSESLPPTQAPPVPQPKRRVSKRHSGKSQKSERALDAEHEPNRERERKTRSAEATAEKDIRKNRVHSQPVDARRSRFTKKSIESLLNKQDRAFDLTDIDLPPTELHLLEKFVDALSKLSVEVQMDAAKRAEGRRRMNNALRALEGWI